MALVWVSTYSMRVFVFCLNEKAPKQQKTRDSLTGRESGGISRSLAHKIDTKAPNLLRIIFCRSQFSSRKSRLIGGVLVSIEGTHNKLQDLVLDQTDTYLLDQSSEDSGSAMTIKRSMLVGGENEMGTSKPAVAAVLRMEGEGDASYVKYSAGQANINAELRPMLADAIAKFAVLPSSGEPIRVADLGCSVGANALGFAECITSAVLAKVKSQLKGGGSLPDVQYFFSDLPSNDFNNLFLSLAPLKCDDGTANGHEKTTTRNYFAAAVPGSFYDRLFPQNSLHVVMSAWSMHWLSHVSPRPLYLSMQLSTGLIILSVTVTKISVVPFGNSVSYSHILES